MTLHANRSPASLMVLLGAALVALPLQVAAQTVYSLRSVEAKPIPRAEFFQLWKDVALGMCKDARKNHNLSIEECRTLVDKRAAACVAQRYDESPKLIRTTAESRIIGREVLHCAMPHYFCHGEEVKTEAEVMARCGDRPSKPATRQR